MARFPCLHHRRLFCYFRYFLDLNHLLLPVSLSHYFLTRKQQQNSPLSLLCHPFTTPSTPVFSCDVFSLAQCFDILIVTSPHCLCEFLLSHSQSCTPLLVLSFLPSSRSQAPLPQGNCIVSPFPQLPISSFEIYKSYSLFPHF